MPPRTQQLAGNSVDRYKFATGAKRKDAGKKMPSWSEAEDIIAKEYLESILRGDVSISQAARLLSYRLTDRSHAACQNRLGKLVKDQKAANALRDS